MKTLSISISEQEFVRYNLSSLKMTFEELVRRIRVESAREALLRANKAAEASGLSEMTLEEINEEIMAVRNAKNRS